MFIFHKSFSSIYRLMKYSFKTHQYTLKSTLFTINTAIHNTLFPTQLCQQCNMICRAPHLQHIKINVDLKSEFFTNLNRLTVLITILTWRIFLLTRTSFSNFYEFWAQYGDVIPLGTATKIRKRKASPNKAAKHYCKKNPQQIF